MKEGGLIVLLIVIVLFYRHTSTLYRYIFAERAITLEAHMERLEDHLDIQKPPGVTGELPVVVVFPGCLHLLSHNPAWQEFFLNKGYAVVTVDSFTPRKFDVGDEDDMAPICRGRSVRGFDRAADVYAIVEYLKDEDWVDTEKIMLAGWSHGAWAIMDAVAWHVARSKPHNIRGAAKGRLTGIDRVFLMYPHCGFGSAAYVGFKWIERVPTLMIVAGKDNTVKPEHCARWHRKQKGNSNIEYEFFRQADHTFDIPAPYNSAPKRYDDAYFEEAKEAVEALLTATVSSRRSRS